MIADFDITMTSDSLVTMRVHMTDGDVEGSTEEIILPEFESDLVRRLLKQVVCRCFPTATPTPA